MVFVQEDTIKKQKDNWNKFNKLRTTVKYDNEIVKHMKYTKKLILDSNNSSLKNAPIRNSDKKQAIKIPAYQKFEGQKILPNLKKDLKWHTLKC